MIWFLSLHIVTLLIWSATLLYLPVLIHNMDARRTEITLTPKKHDSVARFVFTVIATPSALMAILSGTAVFLVTQAFYSWFIVKLSLVAALVAAHALAGLMVLRQEGGQSVKIGCRLLTVVIPVLMLAIVWIVLTKPVIGEAV